MSEYGLQLREKQKAKFIYGVLEKPFRNYYAKAERMSGMVGENLMIMLESRLDNVLFRAGFGRTRKETRQIVDHKHVLVNGKCVNIPSYLVKAGDVVTIKEKVKDSQRYKDVLEVTGGRLVPEWLDVDQENLSATVKQLQDRLITKAGRGGRKWLVKKRRYLVDAQNIGKKLRGFRRIKDIGWVIFAITLAYQKFEEAFDG